MALGKWCIGSQKGHPRTPGMEFFAVEVIVFFPYTLTKGVRVEKDKIK